MGFLLFFAIEHVNFFYIVIWTFINTNYYYYIPIVIVICVINLIMHVRCINYQYNFVLSSRLVVLNLFCPVAPHMNQNFQNAPLLELFIPNFFKRSRAFTLTLRSHVYINHHSLHRSIAV